MDLQIRQLERNFDSLAQKESFERRCQLQRTRQLHISELQPGDVILVGSRRKNHKNIHRFGGFKTPVKGIVMGRKNGKQMMILILPGQTRVTNSTHKISPMRTRPFTLIGFEAEISLS